MHFALNDDQTLLREAIERFTAQRYDPSQRLNDRESFDGYRAENWAALAEMGVLALPFSIEDGGLGGGAVEIMTVMEILGRALAVEPMLEEIIVAAGLLARAATPAQKETWLPRIMGGSAHVALAHFEQQAGFDLANVGAKARQGSRGFELHGDKSLVPVGQTADAFIVSAREADGAMSLYLVSAQASGVERRGYRLADGSAASDLVLRGANGDRLAGGFEDLLATADSAHLAASAEMLGIMSTLFDSTLEHVRHRKQFGAALGSFQVIQHRLVDLYVSLELSRSQLYRAALGSGSEASCAIAGTKAFISAAAWELGEACIHLHGAMGTTDELAIGRGHKRLMVLATLFGDADFQLERFKRGT